LALWSSATRGGWDLVGGRIGSLVRHAAWPIEFERGLVASPG
jgi:hypothetical protein